MLVKYYLSDSIKAPFEDFALGLRIVWASLAPREREVAATKAGGDHPLTAVSPPPHHQVHANLVG